VRATDKMDFAKLSPQEIKDFAKPTAEYQEVNPPSIKSVELY